MKTITYMTGLLTFYLKGEITAEQNFLKLKIPNTILTLIPLGAKKDNVPVNQISSVSSNFKLLFKDFVVGIIEVLIAFSLFSDSALWGLILLLVGASTIITSFKTELNISTTSSVQYIIPFLIFEKSNAEQAEQMINDIISNRLSDTNNRQVTEASTNAIVNAINAIKQ
jgi:hypothetical protein